MAKLHIVATLSSGYAREDAPNASVVGAYTNADTAKAVRSVSGPNSVCTEVEIDYIPQGLMEAIKQFGIKLPQAQ